jgi:hypothetical protein
MTVWDWMGGAKLPSDSTGKEAHFVYDKQHGKKAGGDESLQNDPNRPSALSRSLSASDLIARAADLAVSGEYPLGQLTSERPRDYALNAAGSQIDAEETQLLKRSKQNHRFLSSGEIAEFEKQAGANKGGTEHDVWHIEGESVHSSEGILKH